MRLTCVVHAVQQSGDHWEDGGAQGLHVIWKGGCLPGRSQRALHGSRQTDWRKRTGRKESLRRSTPGSSPELSKAVHTEAPVTPKASSGSCHRTLKKGHLVKYIASTAPHLPRKSHSDMKRSRRQGGILSLWGMPEQPDSLVAALWSLPKPGQWLHGDSVPELYCLISVSAPGLRVSAHFPRDTSATLEGCCSTHEYWGCC